MSNLEISGAFKVEEKAAGGILPVGTIISFAGKKTPQNYLFCDGSTFSKNEYPELFEVLESTTLPNLDGRFLEGSSTPRTLKDAGLPNIKGYLSRAGLSYSETQESGALKSTNANKDYRVVASTTDALFLNNNINFDASKSNAIFGKSSTVQPKAYTVRYLIRAK